MTAGRWRVRAALTGTVALGLMAASAPAAGAPGDDGAEPAAGEPRPHIVNPQLRAEADAAGAGEQVEYLIALAAAPDLASDERDREAVVAGLKETAEESQRPVVEYLEARGGEVVNTFWLDNLLLVRSSTHLLTGVTAAAGVEAVVPVTEVEVPEPAVDPTGEVSSQTVADRTWGLDRIGAHRVWDELGVDGSGVRVAVLDTGVDITHPDLAGKMVTDDPDDATFPGGWMEFDDDGQPVASEPHDTHWHGTHVSGTIHGGDNFQDGTAIGGAPGADLMHGMVLSEGSGSVPQIVAGMQWAVDPYDHQGDPAGQPAQVVNMSLGPQGGGVINQLVDPIRNLHLAGVMPVISSGNCGDGCHGSPGNVYESFAIGATDIDDDVASFSSGAVVRAEDFENPPSDWPESWMTPDVAAPGVDVISSVPAGTFPEDPESVYGTASGTSMAAPHTAAAAALMLASDQTVGIEAIADLLIDTSFFDQRHGQQRPNSRFGHGRIDAFQSVSRLVVDSGVAGQVTDAGSREAVAGIRVEVLEADVSMTTDAEGGYEFRLPPGTYTLELSWLGQVVATVPDVVVEEGAVADRDIALGGVAGQVTDGASGDPVADVSVDVVEAGLTASTDADGGYRLYLAPGRYTLEFSWSDQVVATVPDVVVDDGAVAGLDVALGGVAGQVTDEVSGVPVADASVEVVDTDLSAVTDADGGYRFYLAPGGYALEFTAFGYEDAAVPDVEVVQGSIATADVELEPLPVGTITGTVTLSTSGHAVPGVVIEGEGTPIAGTTSGDGTYTITDVPVGMYSLVARSAQFPEPSPQRVTVEQDGVVTADFSLDCGGACQLDELWEARYDGSDELGEGRQAGANAMGVSPDGTRVFVTGSSNVSGVRTDYATVAYDAVTGQELWTARYNGPSAGRASAGALAVSPDGSRVYITGGSNDELSLRGDYATVAYDAVTGQELWAARYDGPSDASDVANSVGVSPDGSQVYVTGQSPGADGLRDYATVAYDAADGDELWVTRYNGPSEGQDIVQDLGVSPDGGQVFVTGFSEDVDAVWEYATVAYDSTGGDELWVARYNGTANATDQASAMAVSPDGVFVTGISAGAGTGFDYATVGYDPATGDELWVARYNGPVNGLDRPAAMAVSPDGSRVLVTGESAAEGTGFAPRDYATVAYHAADGQEVWVARNGASDGRDAATGVGVSPDGSRVFVTGLSLTADRGTDYLTLAYDADAGRAIWAGQYDGPASLADFPNALAVSPDGSQVFVAGHSRSAPPPGFGEPGLDTGVDFATVAYDAEAEEEFPVFVPHDLRVEPETVGTGEPASVTVAVANVGTVSGEYDAIVMIDGEPEDSTTVEVGSGEITQVRWTVSRETAGTFEIRVGQLTAMLNVVDVTCDETITGFHLGALTVSGGVTCLSEDAWLAGPVTVHEGAGLVATGATVTGPVSATGAEVVELRRSRLSGRVRVSGTTGRLTLSGNRVTGPVDLHDNATGDVPILVSGNRILGLLSCSGNRPPPADGGDPNTVTGPARDQCAGL